MKKYANDPVLKLMNTYIAHLRALYFIHQSGHWQTKGSSFYGDHLLLERLYESAQDSSDKAAEKTIGLFGPASLNIVMHAEIVNEIINKVNNLGILERSLAVEKEFLNISKITYENLKKLDEMTLGLDDMIMGIHSKSEEACYLLQQALN